MASTPCHHAAAAAADSLPPTPPCPCPAPATAAAADSLRPTPPCPCPAQLLPPLLLPPLLTVPCAMGSIIRLQHQPQLNVPNSSATAQGQLQHAAAVSIPVTDTNGVCLASTPTNHAAAAAPNPLPPTPLASFPAPTLSAAAASLAADETLRSGVDYQAAATAAPQKHPTTVLYPNGDTEACSGRLSRCHQYRWGLPGFHPLAPMLPPLLLPTHCRQHHPTRLTSAQYLLQLLPMLLMGELGCQAAAPAAAAHLSQQSCVPQRRSGSCAACAACAAELLLAPQRPGAVSEASRVWVLHLQRQHLLQQQQ